MARRKQQKKLVEVCVPNLWALMRKHDMHTHDRMVWLYIVTGDHNEGLPGLFRLTESQIEACADLYLTDSDHNCDFSVTDVVQWAVERFMENGILFVDPEAGVMMIPGAVGHRPPRDEHEARLWARMAFAMPDCELVNDWREEFTKACESCPNLRQAFDSEWASLDGN
jgi:hypothetical protein